MSAEQELISEPFLIRAHHLSSTYIFLFDNGENPNIDEIAARIIQNKETMLNIPKNKNYKRDVLGYTPFSKYKEKYRNILINFLTLPDEHSCKIIAGERDHICDLCFFGTHCNRGRGGDMDFVREFFGRKAIREIRSNGYYKLPIGEVRQILKQKLFEG